MGLDTIAAATGEDASTIEDVYEPYLLQLGLIARTPRGRIVLAAGYAHMGCAPPGESARQQRLDELAREGVPIVRWAGSARRNAATSLESIARAAARQRDWR